MVSQHIDILPSHQIDRKKWDDCINKSPNNLIYTHSYYLDHLADNWHGIIVNDYDCVMAVPWRKKLRIRYCYDVPFIQQLGIFKKNEEMDSLLILDTFFKFIKYGHYNFNYSNVEIARFTGVRTTSNFIIDLNDKKIISNNYTKSFTQSLQNSKRHHLTYITAAPIEAIDLYKKRYSHSVKNIKEPDYKKFIQLTQLLVQQDNCVSRKIINKNGHTISIVLLLKDKKRLYNIINVTNDEGRKTEANYYLYSQIFTEFSGKGLLFDLEGSELYGVKSFYKKFGAIEQPYYRMHINNLPPPLNLFKTSVSRNQ
jgi:hypothetical protein